MKSNRSNSSKKKINYSLKSPFESCSFTVKNDLNKEIFEEFQRLCQEYDLAFKKPKYHYKMTKSERKDALRKKIAEDKGLKYRSAVKVGLNSVMKAIEKKENIVVIYNRSLPKIMTQHIDPICSLRNIPVIPFFNMDEKFSQLLNLKNVNALSISMDESESNNQKIFSKLIHIIKKNTLEIEDEKLNIEESSSESEKILFRKESTFDDDKTSDTCYIYKNEEDPFHLNDSKDFISL